MPNYKLFSFDKVSSTQTVAAELVASNRATDRTVILAAAQSAGRGRYHREWVSHHGNLYASFIYEIASRDPTLSYTIAVAVAETMMSFGIDARIKWPNDIMVDGKKISGTLIEYSRNFVIVGIGINIKTNPTLHDVGYKTARMDDYHSGLTVNEVMSVLINNIDDWMRRDFAMVRARWTELATAIGTEISYQGKSATFCGINETGAAILRCGSEYKFVFGNEIG